MEVLGIDLAASPASTGVVVLVPASASRWEAIAIDGPADDDGLVARARSATIVGVDAPLGWPDDFVDAVAAHRAFEPWPGSVDRSPLVYRETDRATRRHLGRYPLSVSADRLGVLGMRCALLQRRWADEVWGVPAPRDGSGTLAETYPAAAFRAWAIDASGYKARTRPDDARRVRSTIVEHVVDQTARWLDLGRTKRACVDSDHVLDALVCALVAIAIAAGQTDAPPAELRGRARREGWIHVPTVPLTQIRPPWTV